MWANMINCEQMWKWENGMMGKWETGKFEKMENSILAISILNSKSYRYNIWDIINKLDEIVDDSLSNINNQNFMNCLLI